MSHPRLAPLVEALSRLDEAWGAAGSASNLSRHGLLECVAGAALAQRHLDAIHAELAAAVSFESRAELGAEGLAKQQGYRSAAALLAATTGVSHGDAARFVRVGEAVAPRRNLLGDLLPARFPAIAAALAEGSLGLQTAALIITLLERLRLKIGAVAVGEAEQLLATRAAGMPLDDVRKLLARAEAWLDPDGIEPKEREARDRRSLTMFERDGSLHLALQIDVATGASIKAAIQAYVTAAFRARRNAPDPDAADADHRTVAMIQADALAAICDHAIGCRDSDVPSTGATVIVRVNLDDLTSGCGSATIDGSDHRVSVSSCRRMAASGGIIPVVMGSKGEILDWGREKRLFTRAQRRALVERDGGSVMCALPPQMTKAHHLRWWQRDAGPTDLDNGVLLCESCHHRVHDNGWEIRVDGVGHAARVWLIPPAGVDPHRTPRLGGRARYDMAA